MSNSCLRRRIAHGLVFAAIVVLLEIDGAYGMESGGRSAPVSANFGTFAPAIVSRSMWRAKPPLTGMSAQQPIGIILHNTGVASNPKLSLEAKLRNLQSFSQRELHRVSGEIRRVWPDVPYHFYIDALGRIGEGRDIHFAGDTNTNYNTIGFIQIVVEGDFEKEKPAPEQLGSIQALLVWLMLSWDLRIRDISVHKDHAPTTCPGRNFMTEMPSLLSRVTERQEAAIVDICTRHSSSEFDLLYCGR